LDLRVADVSIGWSWTAFAIIYFTKLEIFVVPIWHCIQIINRPILQIWWRFLSEPQCNAIGRFCQVADRAFQLTFRVRLQLLCVTSGNICTFFQLHFSPPIQSTPPSTYAIMATVNDAASAEMSSSRFQPRPHGLRTANLPDLASPDAKPTDAHAISLSWITAFNEKLKTFNRGLGSFAESPIFWDHFLAEFYWRDMLCLTWDFHTLHNQRGLANLFGKFKNRCRIQSLGLDETSALRSPTAESNEEGQVVTVQAFLYITTDVGSGTGIVKLKPIDGTWRAFTLFTCLTELRGHEELVGKGRPHGGDYSIKRNWYDCRLYEEAFEVESPAVLILGMFTPSRLGVD